MPRLASLAVLLWVLALAGCGGSSSSGGDDPASLVPADAPVFFEATLRPEGDVRDGALDAAGKVLRTNDPRQRIEELVQQAFAESGDDGGVRLDYARDVKPWLGEKAGVWAASTDEEGQDSSAVAILSATDTDKARDTIDRLSKESDKRFSSKSYEGVDYKSNGEGDAVGVVDDFAVIGTEAEFRRTVAAADGDGLDDDKRYKDAVGELSDDRLAHVYVDARALVDQALRQSDPSERRQAQQVVQGLQLDELGPIAASFSADGSRLAVDGFTSGSAATTSRGSVRSPARAPRPCSASCPVTRGARSARRNSARRLARCTSSSPARS